MPRLPCVPLCPATAVCATVPCMTAVCVPTAVCPTVPRLPCVPLCPDCRVSHCAPTAPQFLSCYFLAFWDSFKESPIILCNHTLSDGCSKYLLAVPLLCPHPNCAPDSRVSHCAPTAVCATVPRLPCVPLCPDCRVCHCAPTAVCATVPRLPCVPLCPDCHVCSLIWACNTFLRGEPVGDRYNSLKVKFTCYRSILVQR